MTAQGSNMFAESSLPKGKKILNFDVSALLQMAYLKWFSLSLINFFIIPKKIPTH